MEIKINDYYEPDHFRAISEDNYNISRTCEYEKNEMHHIHNTSEILLVEDGAADYYISGRKYHVEPYDILVIGAMEHHLRRIDRLPFSRYGFTAKPTYYRSIILDHDLQKVFGTPPPDVFVQNYKNVDRAVFGHLIDMLCYLKEEGDDRVLYLVGGHAAAPPLQNTGHQCRGCKTQLFQPQRHRRFADNPDDFGPFSRFQFM